MSMEFWPGYAPMGGLAGNIFSKAGISGMSPVVGDNLSSSLAALLKDPSLLKTIGASGASPVVGNSMSAPLSSLADSGSGLGEAMPFVGSGLGLVNSLANGQMFKHPLTESGKLAGSLGGALAGQALIPVPGVGAAIGGMLGNKLGSLPGSIGAK